MADHAERSRAGGGFVWVLLIAAVFAVAFELGRMDVVTDNEGQRATPPVEMVQTGDYVTPRINGIPYLVKPPLLYWAIAGVYRATGVISEMTARVPTAASAVVLALFLYAAVRRASGETAARLASLALIASPYVLDRARWANLDTPLTCALFIAVWAAYRAVRAETRRTRIVGTLGAGVAFGAALLLKGPPAALFFAMGWLACLVIATRMPSRTLRHGAAATGVAFALALLAHFLTIPFPVALVGFLGLWVVIAVRDAEPGAVRRASGVFVLAGVIGVVLAAPWAVAVVRAVGWTYIRDMLDNQVMERTYTASRINSGDPFFYLYYMLGMAAPWSLLLPLLFARDAWRNGGDAFRFSALTAALGIGAFSMIAGKEPEYVLPAVPFLLVSLAVAVASLNEASDWRRRWVRGWRRAMVVLLPVLACGAAAYYVVVAGGALLIAELIGLIVAGFACAWGVRRWTAAGPEYAVAALAATLALVALIGRAHEISDNWEISPKRIGLAMRELIDGGATVEATPPIYDHQPYPYQAAAFYLRRTIALEIEPDIVRQRLERDPNYYYLTREPFAPLVLESDSEAPYRTLLGPTSEKDLVLIGTPPLPGTPAVAAARAADS